ncbi:MAG: glucose-1-phosphate cytidylyltransferase [Acholeplasmataceae bacterium]|nr:glucose-1-phosphate cytidylyltransferase [Acholeplasmataceae bacterium]
MKVVILAGGFGTRISEESHLIPKPMIRIGEQPILWHIMKYYSSFGFNDFIICCGYKQHIIKDFFNNYYINNSDITFDFSKKNTVEIHKSQSEPWKVTLVDTGLNTMTGGRIKKIRDYIGNDTFMLTYGDGVSNVDLNALLKFHQQSKKKATLTAIQPGGRFGMLEIDHLNMINNFKEKSKEDGGWINGGFMVLEPSVIDSIEGDMTVFEHEPLELLASQNELNAYKHHDFWQCMDTVRDKDLLERLWASTKPPWKVWK